MIHHHPPPTRGYTMKFIRRHDLEPHTRIEIVRLAWINQGLYGKMTQIAQDYHISRTFLYQLTWAAQHQLKELLSDPKHLVQDLHSQFEPLILLLRLEGKCSLPSLSAIFKRLEYQPNSVGYLSTYLQDYGHSVPSTLQVAQTKVVVYLSDEIFAIGTPILVTVDAQSTAILQIQLASDRSAQTWKAHFDNLGDHLFHSIGMASDRGVGLMAGYQAAWQDGLWVCEQFHEFHDLFHRCHQLERKAYGAIGKEDEAAKKFENAKSEAHLQKRLAQYERAHQACEQAMARYDQLHLLLDLLRETLHLCSPLGRLRTVEGIRAELMLLLSLIQAIDDERLPKLLQPIWSHLDDSLVPFQQVASIHAELLALLPQQRVDALVLAWHQDHLCDQSHGQNKHYHQRESQYWLDFAQGLLGDSFPWLQGLVFDKLDSIVKASSLVEMVNSLLRPYLNSCKGHITQETLNLIMFYHNHRRYKSGRRKGKAPIELLTGEALQTDWVDLFIQHKQEVSRDASGASRPALELMLGNHGQTPPSETPSGQAICEPRADSGHPWLPMDVEAA
jgi:hypothetical protein